MKKIIEGTFSVLAIISLFLGAHIVLADFHPSSGGSLSISSITNLTTNGFIKTSNSDGTLSVDTTTYLASLITGSLTKGNFLVGNDAGTAQATSSIFVSSTGSIGVGTTTPWAQLSVNPNGAIGPEFAIGSSTQTDFTVTNGGSVGVGSTTPQRKFVVDGSAAIAEKPLVDATTITWNLATSSYARVTLGGSETLNITHETEAIGQSVRLMLCQDGTGSRTMTWDSAIRWVGGTAPTLTTTANHCDVLSGFVSMATGTPIVVLGVAANI